MKYVLFPLVLLVSLHANTAHASGATAGTAPQSQPPRLVEPGATPVEASRARLAQQQRMLSNLWIFASLNYLYCDVIGLMDAKLLKQYESGKVGGVTINDNFLLGGAVLMQVPLSMVFLSTTLEPRASRVANISAGALMTAVQTASIFVTRPTSYYLFSSAVEVATTGFITAYSLLYMKPPEVIPSVEVGRGSFAVKLGVTF
jgi:hypothetical protein